MKFIQLITDDAAVCAGGACAAPPVPAESAAGDVPPAGDRESAVVRPEPEVTVVRPEPEVTVKDRM
ncbi:hypothetical protein AB0F72_39955 [Actinoplanes sp. NPDC023936]|uniref:hypothetical protein n=1 Tax=Actinoplanes sp. NPDC023936 TaxID=3154910 RepID=UPI003408C497